MTPIARVVMYEVAESLRFVTRGSGDAAVNLRAARATLLGKEMEPFVPGTPFVPGRWVVAGVSSVIDLVTFSGSFRGGFRLLDDIDPSRRSLDSLLTAAAGSLRGALDLSRVLDGYAPVRGRWSMPEAGLAGEFNAVFLIPFQTPGSADYYYRHYDLADGVPCVDAGAGKLTALASDEFALGVPLTKLVAVVADA